MPYARRICWYRCPFGTLHNTNHGFVSPSKALTGCLPSVRYECVAGSTPSVVLPPLALSTKSDAFVTGDPELEASRFEKATASWASIVERRWFRVLSLEVEVMRIAQRETGLWALHTIGSSEINLCEICALVSPAMPLASSVHEVLPSLAHVTRCHLIR